ncbi:hypothetical protein LF1_37120 [Rubripirellula obstinata]|uniref:Uncharacterized protein n=2 Tax=Rubripirellula obstinata TaxID=406547 RepID=A0A5B1CJ29_9BACT|nr:hypothetical protein LF1_37120 [Rubripirellula obstinata]
MAGAAIPIGGAIAMIEKISPQWIGYQHLSAYPKVVGFIMLFAASGILYLTFQDLAPQSKSGNQRAPAVASVLGFLLGVIGQVLLDGWRRGRGDESPGAFPCQDS